MPTTFEENLKTVKREKRSLLPELRALSKQLEEHESEMTTFWKMNPALLILIKGDSVYKVNPAWDRVLGYTQSQIDDKIIYELVHEKDRVRMFEAVNKLKNESQPQTVIVRCKHYVKDEWIFVKMSLSYDSSSDTIFGTGWPLLTRCNDCPFLT